MTSTCSRLRRWALAGLIASATALASVAVAAASPAPTRRVTDHRTDRKPTIVLVHGAWADSSSWDGVVRRLLARGYDVRAFATPLTSLSGDAAALRHYLGAITGSVVVVGHSYGGAVVTDATAGDAHVRALVYVDAFAPDEGEPVVALPGEDSAIAAPGAFDFVPAAPPGPETEFYVRRQVFINSVANDLPARRAAVLAATQRPITLQALTETSTTPGWRTIPSWYQVGTRDRIIVPSRQLAMAQRAHAHVSTAPTGHLPMVSDPGAVTSTILQAVVATG